MKDFIGFAAIVAATVALWAVTPAHAENQDESAACKAAQARFDAVVAKGKFGREYKKAGYDFYCSCGWAFTAVETPKTCPKK